MRLRSRRWEEEEEEAEEEEGTLSIRGLHTNNGSNLFTLQLWFPDIQLIGLAVRRKLNFFINSKHCCLLVLMYVSMHGGEGWVGEGLPPVGLKKTDRDVGQRQGQANL